MLNVCINTTAWLLLRTISVYTMIRCFIYISTIGNRNIGYKLLWLVILWHKVNQIYSNAFSDLLLSGVCIYMTEKYFWALLPFLYNIWFSSTLVYQRAFPFNLQKMQDMKKRMEDEQKQRDAMYYVGVSNGLLNNNSLDILYIRRLFPNSHLWMVTIM